MKIKKGDTVLITCGKDRGKKGKVIKTVPKRGKVLVEGVNLMKKHQKPKKTGEKGQIIQMPFPINIYNVKIICPKCNKATRIKHQTVEGKKYRLCKKCDKEI
jgi:large subunit ribosomal protein L24